MATANLEARNIAATDFAATFGAATLKIFDGSDTELVSHTLTGFGTASGGSVIANAIADATILANDDGGGATYAEVTAGTATYTLTVGTSGTEVIVSSTTFVAGGNSQVTSLQVDF